MELQQSLPTPSVFWGPDPIKDIVRHSFAFFLSTWSELHVLEGGSKISVLKQETCEECWRMWLSDQVYRVQRPLLRVIAKTFPLKTCTMFPLFVWKCYCCSVHETTSLVEMVPFEKENLQSHSSDWVEGCHTSTFSLPGRVLATVQKVGWRLSILPAEARPVVQSRQELGTSVRPHKKDWITLSHAGKRSCGFWTVPHVSFIHFMLDKHWVKNYVLPLMERKGVPNSTPHPPFTWCNTTVGVGRNLQLFHRSCTETKRTV